MSRILSFTTLLFATQFVGYASAAIFITSDGGVPTPNLPGYKTFTVTATSTVTGEQIQGFDFAAHPDNNDPQFGFGIFGALNQISILGGAAPTIFTDFNSFIPIVHPGHTYLEDSQFLVSSTNVFVAPGVAEESQGLMQAAWTWPDPVGQSVPFAQVVTPFGGDVSLPITIRGIAYVTRGGTLAEVPVGDQPGLPPEIFVRGNGIAISSGDFTPSVSDNTDFGVVNQLSTQTRSFRVLNAGTSTYNLSLTDAVLTGPFSIVGDLPTGIGASTSGEPLTLALDTTTLGHHFGSITFSTNDPYRPTFSFNLAAQVIPEPSTLTLSLIIASTFICARRGTKAVICSRSC